MEFWVQITEKIHVWDLHYIVFHCVPFHSVRPSSFSVSSISRGSLCLLSSLGRSISVILILSILLYYQSIFNITLRSLMELGEGVHFIVSWSRTCYCLSYEYCYKCFNCCYCPEYPCCNSPFSCNLPCIMQSVIKLLFTQQKRCGCFTLQQNCLWIKEDGIFIDVWIIRQACQFDSLPSQYHSQH